MKWLLDTDAVIYCIKEVPAVVDRLEATRPADRYVSLITLGELFFGIFRSAQVEKNLRWYRRFVADVKLLPFTPAVAERFGAIKAELAKRGEIVADPSYGSRHTHLSTGRRSSPITSATSVGSRGCDSRTGRSELWGLCVKVDVAAYSSSAFVEARKTLVPQGLEAHRALSNDILEKVLARNEGRRAGGSIHIATPAQ